MPSATHACVSGASLSERLARWSARSSAALIMGIGCASSPGPLVTPPEPPSEAMQARAPAARHCPVTKQPELREPPQLIAPEERVPEFLLATDSCEIYDSRELIGKKPFVVVFFASWCSVCDHKMPLLRDALERRGAQLISLFVSLDDATGWTETKEFLIRHGLVPGSAVPGRDFLGFSLGYNPFRSVPVVVIVGRSGRVVDVQVGVREGDASRLLRALDAAIEEPPESPLLTSFRRR